MAKFEYNITSIEELQKILQKFDKISSSIGTKEFRQFIADKCMQELNKLMRVLGANNEEVEDIKHYRDNNKIDIDHDDYIKISNYTRLEQEDMYWVDPETRNNYPDGISIAYIVEYGIGILGTSQDDWETDVNEHGTKGWVYNNPVIGHPVWTNGYEGKFIYNKLRDVVEEKIAEWTVEYIEMKESE